MTLTLRSVKGSPLTHNEVDANFLTLAEGSGGGGILNVRDFGCVGDGITDDTENFQAALDALFQQQRGTTQYGYGGRLRVPYGTYNLTRLNCWRKDGPGVYQTISFVMEGDGEQNTVLVFSDPDIGFEIGNASGFSIKDMAFNAGGAAFGVGSTQWLVVIGLLNSSGGTGVYLSKFENCSFGGAKVGVAVQAPYPPVASLGEVQGCASELRFENCVFGYCQKGFFVEQYNALDFIFTNCGMAFNDYGVYVSGAGGEVTWLGGSLSNNNIGFYAGSTETMEIIGTRTETGSDVVLETGGVVPKVTVIGIMCAGPGAGEYVIRHTAGTLMLKNCFLGGKIAVGMSAYSLTILQCHIDDTVPFRENLPRSAFSTVPGSVYYRVEGCYNGNVPMPDEVGVFRNGDDRIPFTYSQHLTSLASLDTTTLGAQYHGLNGQTQIINLPSSDPVFAGQIWNDAGALKVSAGNAWSQLLKAPGIKLSNSPLFPLVRVQYHGQAVPNTWASVLGTIGKSAGKWYFEVELVRNELASVYCTVGVALATMAVTGANANSGYAGAIDSCGLLSDQPGSTGDVYINVATFGSPTNANVAGLGYVEGDIVQIAVDTDADRIWFSINNTTWNGGAGTPAAGTGGYDISGIAGTLYPACTILTALGVYDTNNITRESICWQGYFALTNYTPPTGFTRWA